MGNMPLQEVDADQQSAEQQPGPAAASSPGTSRRSQGVR